MATEGSDNHLARPGGPIARGSSTTEALAPQPTAGTGANRLAAVLDWLLASLMGVMLPLAPIAASAIARDGSYLRRYGATTAKAAGHLHGQVKSRAFSRYVLYDANAPSTPETVVGECTHCGNCCLHRRCIYLDWSPEGESRCRIYNSAFWKTLACGRYPESRQDIVLYACPSFSAESQPNSLGPGAEEVPLQQASCRYFGPHPEE